MGQCTGCKGSKVKPDSASQDINSQLALIRADVLNSIHSLHLIGLDCMEGIEKSIIKDDRDLAILLRLKYMYLKEKSGKLQELIKNIDELKPSDNKRKKKETIQKSELFLRSFDRTLVSKDVVKILKKEKEHITEVLEKIERLQVDKSEAEKFIDNEIKERDSCPSRKNRRRYSKRLTSL